MNHKFIKKFKVYCWRKGISYEVGKKAYKNLNAEKKLQFHLHVDRFVKQVAIAEIKKREEDLANLGLDKKA